MLLGNQWQEVANRRNYFVELAEKYHLDPLKPDTWYALAANKNFVVSAYPQVDCIHISLFCRGEFR